MARKRPAPAQAPALPPPNPMWKRSPAFARGNVMAVDGMLLHDLAEHYRVHGLTPAVPNPRPSRGRSGSR